MLVKFGNYEIEVKAKSAIADEEFSEEQTFFFLNELSIMAETAAQTHKAAGYEAISGYFEKASRQIYDQLKEAGCYDAIVL